MVVSEEQMHVSGGNPYVMPQPIWMDADLAGRALTRRGAVGPDPLGPIGRCVPKNVSKPR